MKFENTRNPILPLSYHVPDSEAHVMPDGKLYVYGSFDKREDVFCSEEYHVVSTEDMKHWTIHEESMNGNDIPWFRDPDAPKYPGIDWSKPTPFIQKMIQRDIENGVDLKAKFEEESKEETEKPALLFAPDCIYKDGKYYLYFCMPDDSEGVVVSDSPTGPFRDPVRFPIGGIDPAIFIDDDGQAYYYWGQLFSHGVKLNPDMISFDPDTIVDDLVTEEEHYFHEGSSMRKIKDTYYYVYADMQRGKPTSLGYSTSKSPLGPFLYQGILIDNAECDPQSWNNHGSIECFQGQWYVFYHRCCGNSQMHRRLCVEKIQINEDGTIDEVKMTSQGAGEPFAPGEKIMGYQACGLTGTVYIGINEGENHYEEHQEKLTHISDGDTAVFRYVKKETEWSKLSMTLSGNGNVQIYMNDQLAGCIDAMEGESAGRTVETNLTCPAGEYELKLVFQRPVNLEVYDFTLE